MSERNGVTKEQAAAAAMNIVATWGLPPDGLLAVSVERRNGRYLVTGYWKFGGGIIIETSQSETTDYVDGVTEDRDTKFSCSLQFKIDGKKSSISGEGGNMLSAYLNMLKVLGSLSDTNIDGGIPSDEEFEKLSLTLAAIMGMDQEPDEEQEKVGCDD